MTHDVPSRHPRHAAAVLAARASSAFSRRRLVLPRCRAACCRAAPRHAPPPALQIAPGAPRPFDGVIDLTNEYSEGCVGLRPGGYLCVPLWDGTPPSVAQLELCAKFGAAHIAKGGEARGERAVVVVVVVALAVSSSSVGGRRRRRREPPPPRVVRAAARTALRPAGG